MSEILLAWVGRRPSPALAQLADDYAERIARSVAFSEVRVRPVEGRGGDPHRALALEGAAIRRHLKAGDVVIALDEQGEQPTSEELSARLQEWLRRGRTVFMIGSDLGLDETLGRESAARLALSRLTLPHALARLLLLEQLYRALDLAAGGAYHRGGRYRSSHV